jgi:catechol 2,3-dioxygenase-like lactoylglutathione lyase family enzyme
MLALADVAVVVSNANASADWWRKHLGFAVDRVSGSAHAVIVAPPGDRFVLHLCEGFAPLEPGDTGIAFMTDEIEALVGRMLAGGVDFPMPLQKERWGAMAKFADPDGNVFWLMEAPAAMIRETVQGRVPGASRERKATRRPSRGPPRRRARAVRVPRHRPGRRRKR